MRSSDDEYQLLIGNESLENNQSSFNRKRRAIIIFIIFIITTSIGYQFVISQHHTPRNRPSFKKRHERNPSYLVTGRNGAVASEEARCSQIGLDVLKENGTATDAAIATALCVGVVNCFSSGIGGGGFMVIKPPPCRSRKDCKAEPPISIDFRETISGSDYYVKNFLNNPKSSQVGGLSIGIPGELSGFDLAFSKYGGGVSWSRIFEPSIKLSREFKVGDALNQKLYNNDGDDHSQWMKSKPEWMDVFFPDGREISHVGDLIKRENYSNTLKIIADQGIKPFYQGDIAKQLVDVINREGGQVSMEDFANYQAIVRPALHTTYLNRTIWTTENPSSGPMMIYLLNILEGFQLNRVPRTELEEHRFIESLKFAFARRTELGDPDFLNSTQQDRILSFIPKTFADQTRAKIDNKTYDYKHYDPRYDTVENHGTTHISVLDQWGSAVSLTSTVNLVFGSQVMDPITGIILNDENDDFSVKGKSNHFNLFSSPLNYPQKGKRPVSSMAPIIVEDQEEVWAVLGASGGSRIPSAVAGTLLKLDWGYDLSHAIEDARVHHQLLPNQARIETSYPPEFLASLQARGHKISMVDVYTGLAAVHGIVRRSDGLIFASSDSRKHGVPAAY
ncbi:gamma-glutamyltranspeptidase [Melampsora americana]|nr:gamma-glutamyltranspeptidase [Melampsora americana]